MYILPISKGHLSNEDTIIWHKRCPYQYQKGATVDIIKLLVGTVGYGVRRV